MDALQLLSIKIKLILKQYSTATVNVEGQITVLKQPVERKREKKIKQHGKVGGEAGPAGI